MKYLTKEEATRIMNCAPWNYCFIEDGNPMNDAMLELYRFAKKATPFHLAAVAFTLGRAVGVREERAKRKAVQK